MARFVSYAPFDIDTVNLYWYYAYGTDSLLEKNVNLTVDGQTYPDLFWTQGNDGYDHLELDFLGSGIAQDSLGNITAGTVNFVAEFDLNANLYRWYAEGISSDAVAIYNAALTPSNSDEIYLIQT
ncbi:MAG TPA: hypothetical protein VF757_00285, partial [Sphingomicrobium sp.]